MRASLQRLQRCQLSFDPSSHRSVRSAITRSLVQPRLPFPGRGGIRPPHLRHLSPFHEDAKRHIQLDKRLGHSFAENSTIYALSTAAGRAAIAVIRISGPACVEIYHALCRGENLPKPRYAALRTLYDPSSDDNVLDSGALVLYFPSPKTATGEEVLEFHVHGGPATTRAVLSAIPRVQARSGSIRYAEAGEFTRRAFLNDRMDLTQIEALGDTLSATTEVQRRQSVRGASSGLAKQYEAWRQQLLSARGELEALIDFSEDQHFDASPAILAASVAEQVKILLLQISTYSANAVRGELLRNGISIALLGAPNAGKSSLLNRIVGREAAIVNQEAGTTRDIVEVGVDIGGWYCRLGDTAGLRLEDSGNTNGSTSRPIVGQIEEEGIKRAKQRALESDAVIVVLSLEADGPGRLTLHLDPEVAATARSCDKIVVVINKTDRLPADTERGLGLWKKAVQEALPNATSDCIIPISCKNASAVQPSSSDPGGIQRFLKTLTATFESMTTPLIPDLPDASRDLSIWQDSLGASERQRLLLDDCASHLRAFLAEVQTTPEDAEYDGGDNMDVVLAAESLRAAAGCLAKITGKGEAGDVEEVLGVVFEKFCVGK